MPSHTVLVRLIVSDAARRARLEDLLAGALGICLEGSGPDLNAASATGDGCEVFVVDLDGPGVARPKFWAALRVLYPASRVVALVCLDHQEAIAAALHAGAYFMVEWGEAPQRILRAIDAAYTGYGFFPTGPVLNVITRFFSSDEAPSAFMRVGELELDCSRRTVWRNGAEVALTRLEFDLLAYIAAKQGQVVPLAELAHTVWDQPITSPYLTQQIRHVVLRLRRKIEPDTQSPRYILNRHGLGYWMPHSAPS